MQITTNEPTRYQVLLTNGPRSVLLGYTARVGRIGLVNIARQHSASIISIIGDGEFGAIVGGGTKCRWTLCNGWTIAFGETKRQTLTADQLLEAIA